MLNLAQFWIRLSRVTLAFLSLNIWVEGARADPPRTGPGWVEYLHPQDPLFGTGERVQRTCGYDSITHHGNNPAVSALCTGAAANTFPANPQTILYLACAPERRLLPDAQVTSSHPSFLGATMIGSASGHIMYAFTHEGRVVLAPARLLPRNHWSGYTALLGSNTAIRAYQSGLDIGPGMEHLDPTVVVYGREGLAPGRLPGASPSSRPSDPAALPALAGLAPANRSPWSYFTPEAGIRFMPQTDQITTGIFLPNGTPYNGAPDDTLPTGVYVTREDLGGPDWSRVTGEQLHRPWRPKPSQNSGPASPSSGSATPAIRSLADCGPPARPRFGRNLGRTAGAGAGAGLGTAAVIWYEIYQRSLAAEGDIGAQEFLDAKAYHEQITGNLAAGLDADGRPVSWWRSWINMFAANAAQG